MANITVVGAGAVGTAISEKLQEQGHAVSLIAENFPGHAGIESTESGRITSDLAAGIGCIFKPSSEFVGELVLDSYDEWMRLAVDESFQPVMETQLKVVSSSEGRPAWADRVSDYQVIDETLSTYRTYSFNPSALGGLRIRQIAENMSEAGGHFERRALTPYEVQQLREGEPFSDADFTVVATGLEMRNIKPELNLYPIRGMLIHFPAPEASNDLSLMEEDEANYAITRPGSDGREVVFGGSFEEGVFGCSVEEREQLARTVYHDTMESLKKYGADEPFKSLAFSDIRAVTAGYRPARAGDPVMDVQSRIAIVTGFGGQGWVIGPAMSKKVVADITKRLEGRASAV